MMYKVFTQVVSSTQGGGNPGAAQAIIRSNEDLGNTASDELSAFAADGWRVMLMSTTTDRTHIFATFLLQHD